MEGKHGSSPCSRSCRLLLSSTSIRLLNLEPPPDVLTVGVAVTPGSTRRAALNIQPRRAAIGCGSEWGRCCQYPRQWHLRFGHTQANPTTQTYQAGNDYTFTFWVAVPNHNASGALQDVVRGGTGTRIEVEFVEGTSGVQDGLPGPTSLVSALTTSGNGQWLQETII